MISQTPHRTDYNLKALIFSANQSTKITRTEQNAQEAKPDSICNMQKMTVTK